MSFFDHFPKRDENSWIQDSSEAAFKTAIVASRDFGDQSADKRDYGTDYQIEVYDAGRATNVRVHVQLKGTTCESNADGSVSLSVERKNLYYLLMQRGSIFVCYHVPTNRLLVRMVDDVVCEYENDHRRDWKQQETVTVRFSETFDRDFQRQLKDYAVACARSSTHARLELMERPPEKMPVVGNIPIDVSVPASRKRAEEVLIELYRSGDDRAISGSFDKFRAVLGPSNELLSFAYMAEINLGINELRFNKERVVEGVEVLRCANSAGIVSCGTLHYNTGNAWFALREYERARESYSSALGELIAEDAIGVAARCCKNLGSTMEKLKNSESARSWYTRALELDPNLAEAHFALALWYNRSGAHLDASLDHLDAIIWPSGSAGTAAPVLGWRAEVLFRQGETREAFREVHTLLSQDEKPEWIWPWCARLVTAYGSADVGSSIRFWDIWLKRHPDNVSAQREKLLCMWLARASGEETGCDYDEFKRSVADIERRGAFNPAFLWDRAGHWAQDEGDWGEAANCFRRAFDLSPSEYGYCLGVALNSLGRYEDALPILVEQAESHQPDAMSWFQVAVAREGVGDIEGCIDAYRRALSLDSGYARAWFNLGGVYWNSGCRVDAVSTWREAMRKFPEHELATKLRSDLPFMRA